MTGLNHRVKSFMTRAAFARLCGVTPSMISKYIRRGQVTLWRGRKVDVAASLAALEGSLDEDKRQAALKRLAEAEAEAAQSAAAAGAENAPGAALWAAAPVEEPKPLGWKARGAMFKAKEAELSYFERVGVLIDASELAADIEAAIADFWTEQERRVKLAAAEIASELKMDAEQAAALRAMMTREQRQLRKDFAETCRRRAAGAGS